MFPQASIAHKALSAAVEFATLGEYTLVVESEPGHGPAVASVSDAGHGAAVASETAERRTRHAGANRPAIPAPAAADPASTADGAATAGAVGLAPATPAARAALARLTPKPCPTEGRAKPKPVRPAPRTRAGAPPVLEQLCNAA
ncbi:MAG: hypothetical protein H0T15_03585 [Thermoleophilaceae bacterium]|nr:hypothetical protein [Thermoleophilaceae bacterium]